MPNYQHGKIYAIRCHETDEVYIGATTQSLSLRMSGHRTDFKSQKNITASRILQYPSAYIELIENFPCNSREELNQREGHYIRTMECVNKIISGRTDEEYANEHREYNRERSRIYYNEHRQEHAEWQRKYKEENRIRENEREYRRRKKAEKECQSAGAGSSVPS